MTKPTSFPKSKIKFLLLEGVHDVAIRKLEEQGYQVEANPKSLSSDELMAQIEDAHVVGIRSKTKISKEHIAHAKRLLAIGCFGVGTNQVDLDGARSFGVPVFNAPYGNTRSVAELTLGNAIMLARKAAEKSMKMHQGLWDKSAKGAHEVRGKVFGLVGYGHIGQQVGLLAEAIGMKVVFYDQVKRLPLGNAQQLESMAQVLKAADFVSLHVPAMPGGKALIAQRELALMKKGSCLLNLSRGSLIDFVALKEAIGNKQLAGAAVDVYPQEPKGNSEPFACELAGVDNVILTPHIGGSTEEAQYNIGVEVADTFVSFVDSGATVGAVNFPQVNLPPTAESHRILNVHKNEPGVLRDVTRLISELGANINAQYLSTFKEVGYLVMDVNRELSEEVRQKISELPTNIKTRILY